MSTSATAASQIIPTICTAYAITDALAEIPDSAIKRLENRSVNVVFRTLFAHLLELAAGSEQMPGIEVFNLPDFDPAKAFDPLQGTGYSLKDLPNYRGSTIVTKQPIVVAAIPFGLIPFGEDPAKNLELLGLKCADLAVLGNMLRVTQDLNIRRAVRYVLMGTKFPEDKVLYMHKRGNVPYIGLADRGLIWSQPKVNKALVVLPLGS